jgi:hypothetical protein
LRTPMLGSLFAGPRERSKQILRERKGSCLDSRSCCLNYDMRTFTMCWPIKSPCSSSSGLRDHFQFITNATFASYLGPDATRLLVVWSPGLIEVETWKRAQNLHHRESLFRRRLLGQQYLVLSMQSRTRNAVVFVCFDF